MRLLLVLICLMCAAPMFAQEQITYDSEKQKLYARLTSRPIGPGYTAQINQFFNRTCDSLVKSGTRVDNEPITSTLTKFFQATLTELEKQNMSLLRVPNLNDNFLHVLRSYKREPLKEMFRAVGIVRTRILAAAFKGTAAGDTIRSFADLREMIYSPILIPGRLDKPQYAPYRDTMMGYLANHEPEFFITELKKNLMMQDLTIRSKNLTVKAITPLQNEEQLTEMLPFGLAFQEQRVKPEDIRKIIDKPVAYYTAFTTEMLALNASDDLGKRDYLRSYTEDLNSVLCEYYVEPINELHEMPDAVRFKALTGISTQNLYFVILGGESMFYTSSFMYVFNKFLKDTGKEGVDGFFEKINYYRFGDFLNIISGYGVLGKLAAHMNEEKFAEVLAKYMRRSLSSDMTDKELILQGMNLSEILNGVKSSEKIRNILLAKLDQVRKEQPQSNIMLQRMLLGFRDVLLDRDNSKLKEVEKLYEVMHVDRLKTKDTIIQAALFYDDTDGAASYANYMQLFPVSKWDKEDKGNYLILRSKEGTPMIVYCNKPNTKAKDNEAQNEMLQAIADANQHITSFLHRGHSYHLYKSLRKLPASAQFVYLGSCGGYNDVSKVFQANPDAHIISTRNIGSKYVNDPILNQVTADMLANRDVNWNELWKNLNASFTNKTAKDLFTSYIPPNKYIGIMFIREVFNF